MAALLRGSLAARISGYRSGIQGCRAQVLACRQRGQSSFCGTAVKSGAAPRGVSRCRSHALVVRSSAAGVPAGQPADEENPYEVLGVNPLAGFDAAAAARRRKLSEAEKAGDTAQIERLERAYDKIMASQFTRRASGVTYGGLSVSEDIKFADKGELFPWRPRVHKVQRKEFLILLGITAVYLFQSTSALRPNLSLLPWILVASLVRLFLKLQQFYPWPEGDKEKKRSQNGKRMVRTLGLGFGMFAGAGAVGMLLATWLPGVPSAGILNVTIPVAMCYTLAYLR